MSDLTIDFTQNEAPDAALEMQEVKEFIFEAEDIIDVDALEAYVSQRKDQLASSEEPLRIDISTMMISKKATSPKRSTSQAVKEHMEVEEKDKQQMQQLGQQV